MKSLVSLYTGVTYNRSSIQNWLNGSNNTCPVTMQPHPNLVRFSPPSNCFRTGPIPGPSPPSHHRLANRLPPVRVDAKETARSIEFLEQVVIVLGLILDDIEDREGLKNSMLKEKKQSLDTLLLVLQQGSSYSKIASARVLHFITVDAESKLLIVKEEGVVIELLKLATLESWRDARRESMSFKMVGKEGGTQHFSKWDGRREMK
ncbi:U-box domain-containing protein 29 [Spatholobus suberectus]|nr:U-box domain-containing protein 29 [Spatholobus suberectus]